MHQDVRSHRELAQADYIQIRRLVAGAAARIHQASVMKDGLLQHLIGCNTVPSLSKAFAEFVADDFDDLQQHIGIVEDKLRQHERDLQDFNGPATQSS